MSIFTGAGVALVTPFKEDLSVDYDQLEKFIDFQIDNGTDSIVICGTSGEASTMSHDEQIEVVSAWFLMSMEEFQLSQEQERTAQMKH